MSKTKCDLYVVCDKMFLLMCSFTSEATLIGIDLHLIDRCPDSGDLVLKYNCPAYQKCLNCDFCDLTDGHDFQQFI